MVKIPDDRRYFRIGEASRIIGVEPYVLRYWESEFPQVRPKRADSRQRTYRKEDLEALLEIKRLLYDEKLTIQGARKRLVKGRTGVSGIEDSLVESIKTELKDILKTLS